MKTFDNIYLYHLDAELQKMYIDGNNYDEHKIKLCFLNIVKIAFLLCNKNLYVPFSNYLESPISFDIFNYFNNLEIEINPFNFISTAPNVEMALKRKEEEHAVNFDNHKYKYKEFLNSCRDLPGFFRQRENSATSDIEKSFILSIGTNVWTPLKDNMDNRMTGDEKDEKLKAVPEYLAGRAYISDYIMPFLVSKDDNRYQYLKADKQMNKNITTWYLKSYLDEYNAVCFKDIPFIDAKEILPKEKLEDYPSYIEIVKELRILKKANCDNTSIMEFIEKSSVEQLVNFKYSQEWLNIISEPNVIAGIHTSIIKDYKENYMRDTQLPQIKYGILTVLPEEFSAVKALLDNCNEDKDGNELIPGSSFEIGEINGKYVVLCMIPKAGETDAALYTLSMKYRYKDLKYVLMVGIAGGDPRKTRLGDVVISTDGIIQLDYGKRTAKDFIIRGLSDATSMALVEKTKHLVANNLVEHLDFDGYLQRIKSELHNADFGKPNEKEEVYEKFDEKRKSYIECRRDISEKVNVVLGVVGSENCVLRDAELRDHYAEKYEVVAFEMEVAGVNRASQFKEITFITIRGITDFCDNYKGDKWHNFAAANAAIFTYMLIDSI